MNNKLIERTNFLLAAARELQGVGRADIGSNPLFSHDVQALDSFQLAFMDPTRFEELCARYGVDPRSSEAIMMQASMRTRAHVHALGDSLFLPLGPAEGFDDSQGGTYIKKQSLAGAQEDSYRFMPGMPGQVFHVPAGYAHYFEPTPGALFTAIACVSPRIQRPDGGFDITHPDNQ